ncbi:TIGR03621 family F420-dependent LLM class oxidoreductase [Streptomyces profundus]|uniref:TIGR03621 family F420-dependent LLM class oxidoreductase n=1 Tax=Streptomyces profundus TaxID=2867410 RepID=UPI001D16736D|nr:TIGR03621 family F420-dependent LLM class oxidoreductase [Streptomyces sp. MA3_2.13]UED87480.1 TIGR03621 family F420-dependent LLM class oxidoreductase [Streptomyces sp. MA3_2.13]
MHPFRFAVTLLQVSGAKEWADTCRQIESLGYDVILVPDHLGKPSPFPSLVSAAQLTSLRVGSFVLNTGFYHPDMLARDITTTDQLTGGRLEVGLGTGYAHPEFHALGLDPGSPRDRVNQLERTVKALDATLNDPATEPAKAQPSVPLLIAGNGNRVLRLAAEKADIVGFIGGAYDPDSPEGLRAVSYEVFDERVAYFSRVSAHRSPAVERNFLVQRVIVTDDREAAVQELAPQYPFLTVDEVRHAPVLLIGTVDEIIAEVREMRERWGISYISVLEPFIDSFAPVVEALRGT